MAGIEYTAKQAHEDSRKTPLELALAAIERAANSGLKNLTMTYSDDLIASLVYMQLAERGFVCSLATPGRDSGDDCVLEISW